VKRTTDSDYTGFENDLEKEASVDEVPKSPSRRVFLQPRQGTPGKEEFVSDSDILRRIDLDTRRQLYAEELRAVSNLRSTALVRAFAKVPREHFLGPGPWHIVAPAEPGGISYRITEDNNDTPTGSKAHRGATKISSLGK